MIKELQALIKTQPVLGSNIGIMSLRINPNGWNGHFTIERLYTTSHLLRTGLFWQLRTDIIIGYLHCIIDFISHQSLVKAFGGGQYWRTAKQSFDKTQCRYIIGQNQQTGSQRRRQDQPYRSPKGGPERSSQNNCQSRQTGTFPIKPRFNYVIADQFQHQNQGHSPEHHVPARINGESQCNRENS